MIRTLYGNIMSPTDDCGPGVSTATANSASVFITVHVLYLYIVFFQFSDCGCEDSRMTLLSIPGTCSK